MYYMRDYKTRLPHDSKNIWQLRNMLVVSTWEGGSFQSYLQVIKCRIDVILGRIIYIWLRNICLQIYLQLKNKK